MQVQTPVPSKKKKSRMLGSYLKTQNLKKKKKKRNINLSKQHELSSYHRPGSDRAPGIWGVSKEPDMFCVRRALSLLREPQEAKQDGD
jgi:hypothetical protein